MQIHDRSSLQQLIHQRRRTGISFWLIPVPAAFSEFRQIIGSLADKFSGPLFEPHLTILSRRFTQHDLDGTTAGSIASAFGTVELNCRGLRFSDLFTKSCYLEFEDSEAVGQMNRSIEELGPEATDYQLIPHLSLFYGGLSQAQRDDIDQMIELPASIEFDRLRVITHPSTVTSAADVECWQQLGQDLALRKS